MVFILHLKSCLICTTFLRISESHIALSICPVECTGSNNNDELESKTSVHCIPLCCHMGQVCVIYICLLSNYNGETKWPSSHFSRLSIGSSESVDHPLRKSICRHSMKIWIPRFPLNLKWMSIIIGPNWTAHWSAIRTDLNHGHFEIYRTAWKHRKDFSF